MKLISMTDFVLEQYKNMPLIKTDLVSNFQAQQCFFRCLRYANLLKQPLKLEMFVPCDDDGNVLEEPREDDYSFYTYRNISVQEEYQQAKEKVLFEGFKVNGIEDGYCCVELTNTDNWIVFQDKYIIIENEFGQEIEIYTIESLVEYGLTLTETVKKQIGL